jgi:hypothetical protein
VMYEFAPGQCLGAYVAKAACETPVRTYVGRAALIQREDDAFQATIAVTAPSASCEQAGDAYNFTYSELTITKDLLNDMGDVIRAVCLVSKALSGSVATEIFFYLRPCLYLRPTRQPFESH